jgi:hypothetical protein
LFIESTPTPKFLAIQATSPAMEQAKAVIGKKCLMCHTQNSSLPFYAKFPLASVMFGGHVNAGTAMIDFVALFEKNGADEVLLAKLEQAIKLNFDICGDKTEPQKLSLRYPVAKYQLRCTTYAIECPLTNSKIS